MFDGLAGYYPAFIFLDHFCNQEKSSTFVSEIEICIF